MKTKKTKRERELEAELNALKERRWAAERAEKAEQERRAEEERQARVKREEDLRKPLLARLNVFEEEYRALLEKHDVLCEQEDLEFYISQDGVKVTLYIP